MPDLSWRVRVPARLLFFSFSSKTGEKKEKKKKRKVSFLDEIKPDFLSKWETSITFIDGDKNYILVHFCIDVKT